MTYTRSQKYTNIVVGKHGIQTFEVVMVVLLLLLLSFDVFVPYKCTSFIILDKQFVRICLNVIFCIINYCQPTLLAKKWIWKM